MAFVGVSNYFERWTDLRGGDYTGQDAKAARFTTRLHLTKYLTS
jgi:hypothetical protein